MSARGYCRTCDAAREVEGTWPGRCTTCRTPVEEHPVPDVVAPHLRLLFVGINPGVMTARTRAHFGNPLNPFWALLQEAGLTPKPLRPGLQRDLLGLGIGVTNVVTRATPGSADVTREDILRGRERLARLVADMKPQRLAFVGKQAYSMTTGNASPPLGPQHEPVFDRPAFVLPSTSPANASVSRTEKLRWFAALQEQVERGAVSGAKKGRGGTGRT